jgi:DNA-binding NarL/FixJ family response regulator
MVDRARTANFACKPTEIRYRAVCKDGSTRVFDLSANPIVDAEGKLERMVCCAREVTDGAGRPRPVERRAPVRLLIVDDHAVLRKGLQMLLSSQSDMTVVGEAGDGESALEAARSLKPDVVTLDLAMPNVGGLAILERLRKECPATRVLVLTMHDDAAYLKAVIGAGGAGYVTKTADESEILAAVRAIAQGRTYFSQNLNELLVRALLGDEAKEPAPPTPASSLSEREREVLADVAQGFTNQQIADRMFLSVKTIETYRSRLMSKLGLQDRAQLVRFAIQAGFLDSASASDRNMRRG